MNIKILLIISSVIEIAIGISLLMLPSFTASSLLGVPLDTPAGAVAGRIAGAALASLGIACWSAKSGERPDVSAVVAIAMLLYNFFAVAVLAHAGIRLGLVGPLLWPTIVLHLLLGLWCLLGVLSFLNTLVRAAKQE